jgi:hypothetical protein
MFKSVHLSKEDKMTRNETIRQELIFYKASDKLVHISLKSGRWLNGQILKAEEKFVILDERENGEMLLFYDRIKDDGIKPLRRKTWKAKT